MRVRLRHRKLAQVLDESRISQNAWALRMGISRGHLSNLVNGRHRYPEGETRRKLLRATGLDFEELFAIEGVARQGFARAASKRGNIMDAWIQDLRFALRSLARSPGFSAVALLTLALGLGANTAIFSAVETVLLRPLPFQGADRVVTLWQDQSKQGEPKEFVSPANFLDWKRMASSFEQLALIEPYGVDYLEGEFPQSFSAARVSEGFFEVLSTQPLAGRLFQASDYKTGAPAVVLLSEAVWRGAFAASPDVVGSTVRFDGEAYHVTGVLPADFQPQVLGRESGVWLPRPPNDSDSRLRGSTYMGAVGRLREGVTVAQAQSEMDAVAARLAEQYPRFNTDVGIRVESIADHLLGPSRPLLWLLLAAVGCVLLIACSNIAGLMLVRHHSRRRTLALRGVLGAGRTRILRQLSLESLALALCGGLLGALLAHWMLRALIAVTPSDVPRLEHAAIRPSVLFFGLGLTLLAALAFGAWPALRASRVDFREALQEAGGTTTESAARLRGRAVLVTAQLALACILLVGAGLLLRSFAALTQLDPGYGVDRITALQIFASDRYDTSTKRTAFYRETIEAIQALPQVESAGLVTSLPLSQGRLVPHLIDPGVIEAGRPPEELDNAPTALLTAASPGYFETMGIRLLAGRLYTDRDSLPPSGDGSDNRSSSGRDGARSDGNNSPSSRDGRSGGSSASGQGESTSSQQGGSTGASSAQDAPAAVPAVINESLARRHFGRANPLGRRLDVGYGRGFTIEVIGIVADVLQTSLDAPARDEFYIPVQRFPAYAMTYVVRGREGALASFSHGSRRTDSRDSQTKSGADGDSGQEPPRGARPVDDPTGRPRTGARQTSQSQTASDNSSSAASQAVQPGGGLLSSVQRVIWKINPSQTIYATANMEELYAASTAVRRFALQLLAGFSLAALGLALLGLYAVLSFTVRRGSREIGIRRALGATSASILANVLRRSLTMTAAGLTIGLTAALPLTRHLQSLLYETTPTDPATFIAIALLILICSLLASLLPALRATRTDPLHALRTE
ncbi:MAG TPA: ABC transporter permease [Acidobacteriota bacterium]|nr:ABC transporter permease [Acidobacteriota bacterium]